MIAEYAYLAVSSVGSFRQAMKVFYLQHLVKHLCIWEMQLSVQMNISSFESYLQWLKPVR